MYPTTSADIPSQDPANRKWVPSAAMSQPEPLKVFLQHRIKSILSKEWWDFVVNVNNMNSDHASLLYSVANLCPSFQNFLRTRDKELTYILNKRPQIKPRIFSGSERLDVPPTKSPPKEVPSSKKKNCAAELDLILSNLYPDERSIIKRKPRTYGPISKQKKIQNMKKNQTQRDIPQEDPNPSLPNLLGNDIPNSTLNKLEKSHPSPTSNKDTNHKVEYTVSNYDVNRNKLSLNMKKIKKIKVKKKILTYTSNNDKSRTKYLLENETSDLKRDQIKKYRIKKCSVVLQRLSRKQIKEIRSKAKLSQANKSNPVNSPDLPNASNCTVPPISLKLKLGPSILIKNVAAQPDTDIQADLISKNNPTPETSSSSVNHSSIPSVLSNDCSQHESSVTLSKEQTKGCDIQKNTSVSKETMEVDQNKTAGSSCEQEVNEVKLAVKIKEERSSSSAEPSLLKSNFKKPDISETLTESKQNPCNSSTSKLITSSQENLPEINKVRPSVIARGDSSDSDKTGKSLINSVTVTVIKKEACLSRIDPSVVDRQARDTSPGQNNNLANITKSEQLKPIKKLDISSESPAIQKTLEPLMNDGSDANKPPENENLSISSIKYRLNQKENLALGELFKSKELSMELKTVYCHGGIVPLGKKSTQPTFDKSKHFLSLKEKKMKESVIVDPGDSVSPLKEKNILSSTAEGKSENIPSRNVEKIKDVVKAAETPSIGERKNTIDDKASASVKNVEVTIVNMTNEVDNNYIGQKTVIESKEHELSKCNEESIISTDNLKTNNTEVNTKPTENGSLSQGINEGACIDDVIIIETPNEIIEIADDDDTEPFEKPVQIKVEKIEDINSESTISPSENLTIADIQVGEDSEEPSAKRPRLELNLTKMDFDNISCKECNTTFQSHADWVQHYDNEVPKCSLNHKTTWEGPKVSLIN